MATTYATVNVYPEEKDALKETASLAAKSMGLSKPLSLAQLISAMHVVYKAKLQGK